MGEETKYDEGHNDPANWTWGIFYHNKEDKRLFPPKRSDSPGWGWTVNFANPNSILVLLVILAITLWISFSISSWLGSVNNEDI